MKARWFLIPVIVVALLAAPPGVLAQEPLGTAFRYQGQLKEAGGLFTGDADFKFTLWTEADPFGAQIGAAVSKPNVEVLNGLFTVVVNELNEFGPDAFKGERRWLEIEVDVGGGPVPLTPRQELAPAPYAMYALSGPGGAGYWAANGNDIYNTNSGNVGIGTSSPGNPLTVEGTGTQLGGVSGYPEVAVRVKKTAGSGHSALSIDAPIDKDSVLYLAEDGSAVWDLRNDASSDRFEIRHQVGGANAPRLAIDSLGHVGIGTNEPQAVLHIGGTPGVDGIMLPDNTLLTTASGTTGGWSLTGNAGTTPGTNFLGTTDVRALELHVNGQRALRIEPATTSAGVVGPNLIAGFSGNSVTAGVLGGTIAGGGWPGDPGWVNSVTDSMGTVGGGYENVAGDKDASPSNAVCATVAGGSQNQAAENNATVGGGQRNVASGTHATVAGGSNNTASGDKATVPGGWSNTAAGSCSFAGGKSAKAIHDGTFVWADYTVGELRSTGEDQFLIRASGGVGIGTNEPLNQLDVRTTGRYALRAENAHALGWAVLGYNPANETSGRLGSFMESGVDRWPAGVTGSARATSGANYGVYGESASAQGTGVYGKATATTGVNYGVKGMTSSDDGYAGYFVGRVYVGGQLKVTDVQFADHGNAQYWPWKAGGDECFYYDNSTRQYKENIQPLTDDFDKLLAAKPRTYTRPGDPDRWEIGYIAEEFAELGLDRLLYYDADGAPFGVNYSKLGLYLAEIVKGHRQRLAEKDAEIAELRERLDKLEVLVAELALEGKGGAR